MSESTAVTTSKHALVQVLEARADQIQPFLPQGASVDAVAHAVQLAALKNPQLLAAIPSSLVVAVTRGLRAGLDIGEEWHLLTFKNKDLSAKHNRDVYDVIGHADYKALAHLAIAAGAVRYVDPHIVREGDEFAYQLGLDKRLDHRPQAKRGAKITGAYVILTLPYGMREFHYMERADIEVVRQKSKSWAKQALEDIPWYALKTVVRQGLKLLPKDKRLAKALAAIAVDEEAEREEREPGASVSGGGPAPASSAPVEAEWTMEDEEASA
jgi:recombination protein RecT